MTAAADDVFQSDPDRIILACNIGQVQAWRPGTYGETSVNLSFCANFKRGESGSYTSSSHNFTIADARNIAAVLLKAADHAESLIPQEEAA